MNDPGVVSRRYHDGACVDTAGLDAETLVLAVPDGTEVHVQDTALVERAYATFDGVIVTGTGPDGAPNGVACAPAWCFDELEALDRTNLAFLDGAEADLDEVLVCAPQGRHCTLQGLRHRVDGRDPAVLVGPTSAELGRVAEEAATRFAARWKAAGLERPVGAHAMVASEIVLVPWWEPDACAALVEVAEATDAWGSDPDDPVPGVEVSLMTIGSDVFGALEDAVGAVLVPALRTHWPEFAWCGLHDAFVIRYEPSDGARELALHHDVAQISASMRLVDGYDGGALEFPRQAWDNTGVPVGTFSVWPSLVTHPHRGAAVRSGRKYGLTLWFRLPE